MSNKRDYVISLSEFLSSNHDGKMRNDTFSNGELAGYIRPYDKNNPFDKEHGWFGPRMFGFFDFDGRLLMYRYGKENLITDIHRRGYLILRLH